MDLSEVGVNKNRHPWELSRTKFIISQLKQLNLKGIKRILDIGCGDAYFDKKLLAEMKGNIEIYGVDINLNKDVCG